MRLIVLFLAAALALFGAGNIYVGALPNLDDTATVTDTINMDGTDHVITGVYSAVSSSAIDTVYVYVNAITGSSPTYKAVLESLSGNDPTGTDLGTTSTDFTPSATGWMSITLNNSYSPSKGDLFAVVIRYSSGTCDGSNYSQFIFGNRKFGGNSQGIPYAKYYVPGEGNVYQYPTVAAKTAAGEFYGGAYIGYTEIQLSMSGTPDEMGIKFTTPSGCSTITADSVRWYGAMPYGGTTTYRLYNSSDTVLETTTVSGSAQSGGSYFINIEHYLDTAVSLSCGETYRLTIQNDAMNIRLYKLTFAAAAGRMRFPFGNLVEGTSRTDSGSWTDSTTEMIMLQIGFRGFTCSGGGGGGCSVVF